MYERQYITFLYCFNVQRDYYECHDLLEDLWLEEGREPFYQGLLQVAVSCYHLANKNIAGARKLMELAIAKLSCYPKIWMGIDVDKLVLDGQGYLNELSSYPKSNFENITIRICDKVLCELVEQV
jgi:predicted metal-dependent hydrolase